MVENGTTKFRANPLHDQTLHQNWNIYKDIFVLLVIYEKLE